MASDKHADGNISVVSDNNSEQKERDMVRLSTEQERVSNLISDTVTLLCRNGLHFKSEMKVQGLLGISLDNEVFLVQIEKSFGELPNVKPVTTATAASQGESSANESDTNSTGNETIRKRHHRKRRKCPSPPVVSSPRIKQEPGMEDDLVVIATDTKPDLHDKDSMQESYKEVGQVDYGRPFVRQSQSTMYTQDTSQSVNSSLHSDQLNHDNPGCSAWDDPLASLVTVPDDNTSKADDIDVDVIGDADDSLDPQAMSTLASTFCLKEILPRPQKVYNTIAPLNQSDLNSQGQRQGHGPSNRKSTKVKSPLIRSPRGGRGEFICPVPECRKVFSFSTSMYRHKRVVHNIRSKPREWYGDFHNDNNYLEHYDDEQFTEIQEDEELEIICETFT